MNGDHVEPLNLVSFITLDFTNQSSNHHHLYQAHKRTEMSSPLIQTTLPNKKVVLHYDNTSSADEQASISLLQPTSRTPSILSFKSRSRSSSTTSRSSDRSQDSAPTRQEKPASRPQPSSNSQRPVRKPLRVSSQIEDEPRSLKERLQADLDSSSVQAFSSRRRL